MHYPALSGRTYFNYGGQGVLAQATLEAIATGFAEVEARGSFSHANNTWFAQEIAQTKQVMAEELGVSADSLTLTENTTMGCNIALWSIDWQQGDRLLISDCEHPGVVAITRELSRRYGVVVDVLPLLQLASQPTDDQTLLQVISDYLHHKTRMLCISHVVWNTGQILPLKAIAELCHPQNILVTVDAAQSAGVLPLNLTDLGIDFYAFTAHKWWCAPLGVGGLYINPAIADQVHPTYIGWRGLEGKSLGAKFEVATSAYPLYRAFRVAIATANQWGNQAERYRHLCQQAQTLWQELQYTPYINCYNPEPPQCGLVFLSVAGKSAPELSRHLEAHANICIRAMPHPPCLRASIHYLTTANDLDNLLTALRQL